MIRNLYNRIPDTMPEELFETLLEGARFQLERIVSSGQATPSARWYDQNRDEWVVLLSGRAALLFEGETEITELHPGDYVLIPAHRSHRVEWTDSNEKPCGLRCTMNSNSDLNPG